MVVKSKKVLYSVANNSEGALINAVDAEKGSNYFCPQCNSNLIIRKSGNTGKNCKRPHFAHKNLTHNCTPESALHFIFKTLVYKKLQTLIETNNPFSFEWECKYCKEMHNGNLLKKAHTVKLEYNLKECQPDIALLDDENNVYAIIEVIVTHKPDKNALNYYKNNNIVLIECMLTNDLDLVDIDLKLKKPDSVNVCHNHKCKKCGNYLTKLHMYINEAACYRCGNNLKYAYIMSQTGDMVRGQSNHIYPDDFNNKEINLARSNGVVLKKQYSKTSGYSYLANSCNNCNTFIGNHYMFTEYISQEDYSEAEKNKHDVGYQCEHCNRIEEEKKWG